MKIYYYYETNQILTEEEAETICQKDVLYDDYGIWEFITDNYSSEEIMENLSKDFLEDATKELTMNRLENPDYFLVREIPD